VVSGDFFTIPSKIFCSNPGLPVKILNDILHPAQGFQRLTAGFSGLDIPVYGREEIPGQGSMIDGYPGQGAFCLRRFSDQSSGQKYLGWFMTFPKIEDMSHVKNSKAGFFQKNIINIPAGHGGQHFWGQVTNTKKPAE
jgi:hypothetical protein